MLPAIAFWQRMLSPHMTELAKEVACIGANVHFVAEEPLSPDRLAMGWQAGDLDNVTAHFIRTAQDVRTTLGSLPSEAIHITQGVRANGLVASAQAMMVSRGARQYVIMEAVDLRGVGACIKPFLYRRRFHALAGKIDGVLAIGESTPRWIVERAPEGLRVIPFAYFLRSRREYPPSAPDELFTFNFTGSLVPLKCVSLMIEALSRLTRFPFKVEFVGDGPERARLEALSNQLLPGRVEFRGMTTMDEAIACIAKADCLVLPSAHDGWGAVVSEAQINGTPVVCSSVCGAAGTVRASGFGGVFEVGNLDELCGHLGAMLAGGRGRPGARERLAAWATCLTAKAGAAYLLDIINSPTSPNPQIIPPWARNEE